MRVHLPRGTVARWALLASTFAALALSASNRDSGAPAIVETVDGMRIVHTPLAPAPVAPLAGGEGTLLFLDAVPVGEGDGTRARDPMRGGYLETRSIREFWLAAVRTDEHLIRRLDAAGKRTGGFGNVTVPDNGLMGELVNAGWLAVGQDGAAYFASAVRPEVVRFNAAGRIDWRSTRTLELEPSEPGLTVDRGGVVPRFREVQHGVALGPDGRLYVLTATERPDVARLDVLSRSGRFVAMATVPLIGAISVDRGGRIRVGPSRGRDVELERPAFAPFDLPRLGSAGRVNLTDHAGSVIVVNFWASWCAPCRREMPQLDTLAVEFENEGLIVIGLNEDRDPADARRFLDRIGGVRYSVAEGRGELRTTYQYLGLPYTVVLDRQGRVVTSIHGFGTSVDVIRSAVLTEIDPDSSYRSRPGS